MKMARAKMLSLFIVLCAALGTHASLATSPNGLDGTRNVTSQRSSSAFAGRLTYFARLTERIILTRMVGLPTDAPRNSRPCLDAPDFLKNLARAHALARDMGYWSFNCELATFPYLNSSSSTDKTLTVRITPPDLVELLLPELLVAYEDPKSFLSRFPLSEERVRFLASSGGVLAANGEVHVLGGYPYLEQVTFGKFGAEYSPAAWLELKPRLRTNALFTDLIFARRE